MDHSTLQRKWRRSGAVAEPLTFTIAKWLYTEAINNLDCEKCDPDVVPPLYLHLASALRRELPETLLRELVSNVN